MNNQIPLIEVEEDEDGNIALNLSIQVGEKNGIHFMQAEDLEEFLYAEGTTPEEAEENFKVIVGDFIEVAIESYTEDGAN